MPDPFAPQTVTVTELFLGAGGVPLEGRVTFTPSVTAKTPDSVISRVPVVARVTAGVLSVALVATDAASVTPSGWTYDVVETLGLPGSDGALGVDAWVQNRYSISLPAAVPAVLLSALTKVDPVRESQFQVRSVAGVMAGADGNIALTAEDLEAAGVGFATQAAVDALDVRADALEVAPPNHAARHAVGGLDPLTGYVASTLLGANSGVATLDSGGKLTPAQIPAISISDFLGDVASQVAMLALTGQRGDWANRTDLGAAFILTADDASVLANWKQLLTPVDAVLSVAGKTGVVALVKADVGLGNVDNTTDAAKPISTLAQTALNDLVNEQDGAQLGDLVSSIPRFAASSQDTVSNGFLTIMGGLTLRSAIAATKLRLHVRAAVGSPGIITLALYKGSNRLSLAKQGSDIVATTQFGTIGIKEFTIPSLALVKGDWIYLAILHTNGGTDPAISTLPGPPSGDLINPSAAQTISGYKGGQSSMPSPLDVSASFTAAGRLGWFALAA